MIEWKTQTPQPQPVSSVLESGPVSLTVKDSDGKQFQHLLLSFGMFSNESHDECLKTWPREAIRMAREHLDQFEETLEEEG